MSRHHDTTAATTTGKGATARLSSNLLTFPASRRLPPPPRPRNPRPPRTPRRSREPQMPAPVVELDDRRRRYLAEQAAPVMLHVRVATDRVRKNDLVLCRTARGSYAMLQALDDADEQGSVELDADAIERFEVIGILGRIASFVEGRDL